MIVRIISWVLGAAALLLCLPVAIFLSEVFVAVVRPFKMEQIAVEQGDISVAILIPAHNESSSILPTLADVKSQVTSRDFVLVVADNCTDDTAAIAASAGAHVVERFEPRKVGKGYALDFGVRHLESVGAKVVIVLDADCRIAPGAIAKLSHMAGSSDRPAQALYLMEAPKESPINYQVAQFAWRVKNFVRPLGLARAGLPCQLMGTGMAFPSTILQQASLAVLFAKSQRLRSMNSSTRNARRTALCSEQVKAQDLARGALTRLFPYPSTQRQGAPSDLGLL